MSASRRIPEPVLTRSTSWTVERISALTLPEIKQLRANAERLLEPEIAALCTEVIKARPRVAAVPAKGAKPKVPMPKLPPTKVTIKA